MLAKLRLMMRALNTGALRPGSFGAYGFAFASIGAAALAHLVFAKLTTDITPSIFYNPAIFVAALVGGQGAGVVAIGLSLALLLGVFHSSDFGGPVTTPAGALNFGLYLSAALVIVWVADRYRRFERGEAESTPGAAEVEPISKSLLRYLGALACIAAATGLRFVFGSAGGEMLPLVSYYPAVLIAALIGGMGPGLLALFASLFVIASQSPAPFPSFDPPPRGEGVTLSLYVFASLLTVWLAEKRRYAGAGQPPVRQWVTSVLVACAAVMFTTLVLLAIDNYLAEEHLVLGYLLPTIVIAMHYGSTLAVITSFISGLAAAYFLFTPKFSFYIADPLNMAELAFFLLLAITASKVVAGLSDDLRARNARSPRRAAAHPDSAC